MSAACIDDDGDTTALAKAAPAVGLPGPIPVRDDAWYAGDPDGMKGGPGW
ncbi:hypothetical protein ACWCXH_31985 [Kitasatospora sp. NPDC001660]